MQTLYIIGNGFDRYHGLDTRYHSFAFFILENYSDLYKRLIKYYNLPDLNPKDSESFKERHWADFENQLAGLDFETVLEDNLNYLANPSSPDFRDRDWHAYQFQMESVVDNLTKDLCEAFKEFILSVKFPESVDSKLIELKSNSTFLNFNFTDTLEKYYYVKSKRILYIHGKAKIPDEKLILGHGIDPTTFEEKEKKPPDGLTEEELEMWRDQMSNDYDYSYESGKSELMYYFETSFKLTDEIIKKHESFFDSLKDVKQIIVLGHSISTVDQPYFKKVIRSVNDKSISWIVSYHSDTSHLENLIALGLDRNQIHPVKIETLKRIEPTLF